MNFTGDARDLHLGFLLQCTATVQSATMRLCTAVIIRDSNLRNTNGRCSYINSSSGTFVKCFVTLFCNFDLTLHDNFYRLSSIVNQSVLPSFRPSALPSTTMVAGHLKYSSKPSLIARLIWLKDEFIKRSGVRRLNFTEDPSDEDKFTVGAIGTSQSVTKALDLIQAEAVSRGINPG